jgi:hypothetical protein
MRLRVQTDDYQLPPSFINFKAIHAREWISLATVTYIMNELVSNPVDNALLDEVDFYFLPVINPDGFAFTHSNNRMWRKTRSPQGGNCIGVDANRNFGFEWNSCIGCSSGSCSSETFRGTTYMGSCLGYFKNYYGRMEYFIVFCKPIGVFYLGDQPFSEPEADAMRAYIEEQNAAGVNFQSYISVHSYGQVICVSLNALSFAFVQP